MKLNKYKFINICGLRFAMKEQFKNIQKLCLLIHYIQLRSKHKQIWSVPGVFRVTFASRESITMHFYWRTCPHTDCIPVFRAANSTEEFSPFALLINFVLNEYPRLFDRELTFKEVWPISSVYIVINNFSTWSLLNLNYTSGNIHGCKSKRFFELGIIWI